MTPILNSVCFGHNYMYVTIWAEKYKYFSCYKNSNVILFAKYVLRNLLVLSQLVASSFTRLGWNTVSLSSVVCNWKYFSSHYSNCSILPNVPVSQKQKNFYEMCYKVTIKLIHKTIRSHKDVEMDIQQDITSYRRHQFVHLILEWIFQTIYFKCNWSFFLNSPLFLCA